MMRALTYQLSTDSFLLRDDVPIPEPGPDEIRVKVLATALNPVDAKVAQWKGLLPADISEIVLGLDVCGIVDKLGSDVRTLSVGEYVLYHGRMFQGRGGFAEYAIHDALTTVSLGERLPFDAVSLASTPCAAWTAYRALYDKLRLPRIGSAVRETERETDTHAERETDEEEPSLCIVGASGGVGSFALQFARLSGVKEIIAVCSATHNAYVTSLGATQTVDYRQESIHDGVQRVTQGEGVNLLLDCVGAQTTKDALRSLRYDGLACPIVSFAEGDASDFSLSHVLCQVALGGAHGQGEKPRRRLQRVGREVTQLLVDGRLSLPAIKTISLEQVGDALIEMLKANTTGKIVLKMSE